MVYCLNPDCSKPDNPDNNKICHGCHEDLDKSSKEYLFSLHYRIIKQLGKGGIERIKELLAILVYLHDHNIVHGDIKPENIMRHSCAKKSQENKQSKLVLIDFGSCIKFDDNQKIIGSFGSYTRGYAAIEHIQNKPVFASDIHCLGMTAVRLLTRCFRKDFEDNTFNDWLYVDGELKWREYGEERGNKVSDELADILNKMLEPLVNNRYQSAQEVLDDLNTIIETVEPIVSENNTGNVSKRPNYKPAFVTPPIPPRRKRKTAKKRNQKSRPANIAIIGPRPSGKFTYLASFAYFTNMVKNSPIKCIISNPETKDLIRETQDVLMKQRNFKAMSAVQSIFEYPYYYFSLSIKNKLYLNPFKNTKIKSQGEFSCACRPLPGEFFDAVGNKSPEDRYTERTLDFIKDLTVTYKAIILLADSNLPEKDEIIANTLNNIQPYILPENQQRIALVFSMFETPKLQQYRNDIENFAEMFFPRTVNALDDLIEYKNCDIAYFACSAFGFLEEDGQLVPNVQYYGEEDWSHFGVIKDPKRWKPFGVVAPIYWSLTGEHDKRLLKI